MLTARLFLAAPGAQQLEMPFLHSPAFSLLGSTENGLSALHEITALTPDLLVLDGALAGLDGLALLDALRTRMPAPPRVLFLCRIPDQPWLDLAREKGADAVLAWPKEETALLDAAVVCAQLSLPALAAPLEPTRQTIAEELIRQLGVSPRLKGRRYMQEAAACAACAPQLLASYSSALYPFLAARFSTTPMAVERAIRTAVEHTWLHGDLSVIQALFGFSVDADRGKPTNAEFLAMLAEHVRRETARRLPAALS